MKIGIDARVLDRRMTGTGRYLKNMLDGIPKVDDVNEYYVFINDSSQIDCDFYTQIPVKESSLPEKAYSSYWLNFILPGEAKKLDLDIFFTCNIILPFLKLGKTKTVTVIHDIIAKVRKDFYPLSYRMYLDILIPITINRADLIITDSHHSQNDIHTHYKSAKNKTELLFTYADPKFQLRNLDEARREYLKTKYNLPDKFLLYVGVIEKRKNIEGLFEIADKLYRKNVEIPIVLVGRTGFGYSDIKERVESTNGKIFYINYVEEEDLHPIYNLAHIFIFPSFYEGFGIPPLEAMQSGIPVISSYLTSLDEIVGDAAIKIHPENINDMVEEIIKLNDDNEYYEHYKKLGLARAKEFNYLNSAKKLVEIFNKLKD